MSVFRNIFSFITVKFAFYFNTVIQNHLNACFHFIENLQSYVCKCKYRRKAFILEALPCTFLVLNMCEIMKYVLIIF